MLIPFGQLIRPCYTGRMQKRVWDIFMPTVAVAGLLLLWYKRMMIALPTAVHAAFLVGCGIGFLACGLLLDIRRRHDDGPRETLLHKLDNRRLIAACCAGAAVLSLTCIAPLGEAMLGASSFCAGLFTAAAFLPALASGMRALPHNRRGMAFAMVFFCAGLVNTATDLAELPALHVAGLEANVVMAAACALAAMAITLARGAVFNAHIQAIPDNPAVSASLMVRLGLLVIVCFTLMYVAISLKDTVAYPVAVENIASSGFIRFVELPMWVLAGLSCDLLGRRPLFAFCTLCAFAGNAGLLAAPGSAVAATCTLCSYFCLIGLPCACVCLVIDISYYLSRPTVAGAFCFAPILIGAAVGTIADTVTANVGNDGLFLISIACLGLFAILAARLSYLASPVMQTLADSTPVIALPGEEKGESIEDIAERFELTKRETEVLVLAFRGLTVTQMAEELVVSKSTIKFHITNILRKTESDSREHLMEKLEGANVTQE